VLMLDKSRCLILPDLRLYAGDGYYEDYSDSGSNIDLELLLCAHISEPLEDGGGTR
jgi:hypothetical protein